MRRRTKKVRGGYEEGTSRNEKMGALRVLSAPSAAHMVGRCEALSWEAQTHQQKQTAVLRTGFPPSSSAYGGQSTLLELKALK